MPPATQAAFEALPGGTVVCRDVHEYIHHPTMARFFGEAPPPPAAAAVFGLVYLMISGSVAQKIGKGGPEDIFLSIQALEGAV